MGEDGTILKQRWLNLCERASLDGSRQWQILETAHNSPERAYHNLNHIRDCLEQLDRAEERAVEPLSLEFAIWFHDLVYDTKASDNEEASALAAVSFLQDTNFADKVHSIIMATRHQDRPAEEDAKLMCDIDLSILGRDAQTYKSYSESIRMEYAWVDEASYREGRRKVLENFLSRDHVYQLASFRDRYENQARLNLQHEIDQLTP